MRLVGMFAVLAALLVVPSFERPIFAQDASGVVEQPAPAASPSPAVAPVGASGSPVVVKSGFEPPAGGWAAWVFLSLFLISEILGAIPSIKANGVFQFLAGVVKALAGKA